MQTLVLIDFGSAADLEPPKKRSFSSSLLGAMGVTNGGRIGLEIDSVCISPIYSAPEIFIDLKNSPKNFDIFSCAMVLTQLLFGLFDERTDAAFRQQLEESQFNLESWLARELAATLRPVGIDDAIRYLGERPGMFGLMKDMLHKNPNRRPSSEQALERLHIILSNKEIEKADELKDSDGAYFQSVVEASENCVIEVSEEDINEDIALRPRPLHFVATFDRSMPLGLVLAEADSEELDDFDSEEDLSMWNRATAGAMSGEIYVKGIVKSSQAEELGIVEVGDKITGVGVSGLSTLINCKNFPFKVDFLITYRIWRLATKVSNMVGGYISYNAMCTFIL